VPRPHHLDHPEHPLPSELPFVGLIQPLLALMRQEGLEGEAETALVFYDLADYQPPRLELRGVALFEIGPLWVEALDILQKVLRVEGVVCGQRLNITGVNAFYLLIGVLQARIWHKFPLDQVEDEAFLDQTEDIQANF
jgi:hypothetical protein